MPEITITLVIHVPEGSTVAVAPQVPAGGRIVSIASAAVDRCPVHGVPWKFVPGGVSKKTGKPYNAFHACPEQGCTQRPPQGWKPVEAVPEPSAPVDEYIPF